MIGSFFAHPLVRIARDGFLIQVAAWAVAAPLQTEKFYDLTGSLTFLYLSITSFLGKKNPLLRNKVNTLLVVAWATRLGSFLVRRVFRDGKDRRFDKVKTKPQLFLVYWTVQGLWCILTALPVYIINTKTDDPPEKTTMMDVLGWATWICGFALQVTADSQKSAFRSKEENRDKFITTGVWAWSQHCRLVLILMSQPNYFGEMMMWVGLWLSCSSQMSGFEYLSILCPLFNIHLLKNVSGVPLLRKHAQKVWGNDPLWQEYTQKTNLLLPNIFAQPISLSKKTS